MAARLWGWLGGGQPGRSPVGRQVFAQSSRRGAGGAGRLPGVGADGSLLLAPVLLCGEREEALGTGEEHCTLAHLSTSRVRCVGAPPQVWWSGPIGCADWASWGPEGPQQPVPRGWRQRPVCLEVRLWGAPGMGRGPAAILWGAPGVGSPAADLGVASLRPCSSSSGCSALGVSRGPWGPRPWGLKVPVAPWSDPESHIGRCGVRAHCAPQPGSRADGIRGQPGCLLGQAAAGVTSPQGQGWPIASSPKKQRWGGICTGRWAGPGTGFVTRCAGRSPRAGCAVWGALGPAGVPRCSLRACCSLPEDLRTHRWTQPLVACTTPQNPQVPRGPRANPGALMCLLGEVRVLRYLS